MIISGLVDVMMTIIYKQSLCSINHTRLYIQMRYNFLQDHNNEHGRSIKRTAAQNIHNKLKTNSCVFNVYTNCGIITVVMGKILSIRGYLLGTAQKHNAQ